jgi:hypothetical protein
MDTCNSSIPSDGRYVPNGNSLKLKQQRPPIGWSFLPWDRLFSNQKSLALGPVLGGLLVQALGSRSIFIVNVPVGLLALWLRLTIQRAFAPPPIGSDQDTHYSRAPSRTQRDAGRRQPALQLRIET